MHVMVATLLTAALNQAAPTAPGVHELSFATRGAGMMLYAISIPKTYDPQRPAPLVLVLHSGGERMRYYGSAFMRLLVEPALGDLRAIMVAPDCPTNAWTDAAAEDAVMALLEDVLGHYNIDRRRVLVTGFSLGGRGHLVHVRATCRLLHGRDPNGLSPGRPSHRSSRGHPDLCHSQPRR
jgi:poly(3-hydroxybutyrate) depolymerase